VLFQVAAERPTFKSCQTLNKGQNSTAKFFFTMKGNRLPTMSTTKKRLTRYCTRLYIAIIINSPQQIKIQKTSMPEDPVEPSAQDSRETEMDVNKAEPTPVNPPRALHPKILLPMPQSLKARRALNKIARASRTSTIRREDRREERRYQSH
jgi:hypothetical protein